MTVFKALFIIGLTLTLGGMIAEASRGSNRNESGLEAGQPELSGVDPAYKHGHWCIDARSF